MLGIHWFIAGAAVMYMLHLLILWQYKKILLSKAHVSEQGKIDVEFILGKPYVVVPEEMYVGQLIKLQKCEELREENKRLWKALENIADHYHAKLNDNDTLCLIINEIEKARYDLGGGEE